MSDEHSQRTYNSAKDYILSDPRDHFGKALTRQLISEARKPKWAVMGVALYTLARLLAANPEAVETARKILLSK